MLGCEFPPSPFPLSSQLPLLPTFVPPSLPLLALFIPVAFPPRVLCFVPPDFIIPDTEPGLNFPALGIPDWNLPPRRCCLFPRWVLYRLGLEAELTAYKVHGGEQGAGGGDCPGGGEGMKRAGTSR